MSLRGLKGLKAIAALLVFVIAQLGIQVGFAEPRSANTAIPVPQQFFARLRTKNNGIVTVNGLSATTGATIATDATIETDAVTSATVNLGALGNLDLAPNTKVVLTYDDQGNVKVTLLTGCAVLTTKKNANGQVVMADGTVVGKNEKKKGGVLDICFPPGATSPIVNQGAAAAAGAGAGSGAAAGAGVAGGGGLFGIGPLTIFIVEAGAVTAAMIAGTSGPSTQVNPSPAL
jgi:hypothetical protein